MMHIDFPYHIGKDGRTATTDRSDHIRDLIRQVLFTSPGERVNRPTFGSGLNQLVFEPNSFELAATLEFLVRGSLQEWLSDVIEVVTVSIEVSDSTLTVSVSYNELGTSSTVTELFTRSI